MNSLVSPASAAPAPLFRLAPPTRRRRSLVSLTPLIDVVFILLIFFMLASNFLEWRQLPLTTAVASAGEGEGESGIQLLLSAAGQVTLDGITLPVVAVGNHLGERLRANPKLPVALEAGQGVTMQQLVTLFDGLVAAGARNITLVAADAEEQTP